MSADARSRLGGSSMSDRRPLVLLVLVLTLTAGFAGCIAAPDALGPASAADDGARDAPAGRGSMTADERVEESEGVDPQSGLPLRFAATRIHSITGTMDLDSLPIVLATVDGDVTVTGVNGDAWALVVTLRGTGATPELAREERDSLALEWSHESAGAHFVRAAVHAANLPARAVSIGGRSADVALEVPARLLTSLDVRTSDADVAVSGLRATSVELRTSDGDVVVSGVTTDHLAVKTSDGDVGLSGVDARDVEVRTSDGDVAATIAGTRRVSITTSDGDVTASLEPAASGAVDVRSSDGDVHLELPEGARVGYALTARTSDGAIDVGLRDGATDYDEDRERASFRTRGLASRAIQVGVGIVTSDGDISVRGR